MSTERPQPSFVAILVSFIIGAFVCYIYISLSFSCGSCGSFSVGCEQYKKVLEYWTSFQHSDKVAVMLSTRADHSLIPTILRHISHLPHDWLCQIFGTQAVRTTLLKHPITAEHMMTGKIAFEPIDESYQKHFDSVSDYNRILLNVSFWEAIRGKHVLIFQPDVALCANSFATPESFFPYSFIGSPWPHTPGCGNGGYSLRNRDATLVALHLNPKDRSGALNEDLWFCFAFRQLNMTLPTREESFRFGVEGVWPTNNMFTPLGIHKTFANAFDLEKLIYLSSFCPESLEMWNFDNLCKRCRKYYSTSIP
jgi:Protein of unknown function (DUF5672)